MTHDPMKSAAADAAATAAAYSARNTYALGWEAGARASRLEEGTEYQHLQEVTDAALDSAAFFRTERDAAIRARDALLTSIGRLAHTSGIAWADADEATALGVLSRRIVDLADDICGVQPVQDATDALDAIERRHNKERMARIDADEACTLHRENYLTAITRAERLQCERDLLNQSTRAATRARDEVGIQLVAAQERLRLAMACVEAARDYCTRYMPRLVDALRALDTVPGDALAHPTHHLEALGIDTANVKGVE